MNNIRIHDGVTVEDRNGPVEVCEHITLPNAYPDDSHAYEYATKLRIRCHECDETYTLLEKIN